MEYARQLGAAVVVLVLATLAVVMLKEKTEQVPRKPVSLGQGEDFRMTDNIRAWANTEGGDQMWSMEAENAVFSKSREVLNLEQVAITMPVDNRPPVRVFGTTGVYDIANEEFTLSDGVTVRMDDLTARIPTVRYHMQSREIESDDTFRATDDRMTFEGTGLRANVDARRLTVLRDVRVQFRVPKSAVDSGALFEGAMP